MRGFLLGLSSGTVCLASCAPVVIPYLLGESRTVKENYRILGQFLLGRLLGYLGFAVLAWALGLLITENKAYRQTVFGLSYVVLSALLMDYCFRKQRKICPAEHFGKKFPGLLTNHPVFFPLALGLLTGLNLCPPLLLAFTTATVAGSLGGALLFFICFFLGTAIFFLPVPLVGLWKRNGVLRHIGRMAAGIIGGYYFLLGILTFIGGIKP